MSLTDQVQAAEFRIFDSAGEGEGGGGGGAVPCLSGVRPPFRVRELDSHPPDVLYKKLCVCMYCICMKYAAVFLEVLLYPCSFNNVGEIVKISFPCTL